MEKSSQARAIQIGIYCEDKEKLNSFYLGLLLHNKFDYRIKGDFVVHYEPNSNGDERGGRGIVTVTGDFNILEVCDLLSRNFKLTGINEKDLKGLGKEILSKLEEIIGETQ